MVQSVSGGAGAVLFVLRAQVFDLRFLRAGHDVVRGPGAVNSYQFSVTVRPWLNSTGMNYGLVLDFSGPP